MPKTVQLVFVEPAGHEHHVEAEIGQSVMQAASTALVPGIEASCGGGCVCATCHCYLQESTLALVSPPDATERSMLECVAMPRPTSRLTCQVIVSADFEGARIQVAESQH